MHPVWGERSSFAGTWNPYGVSRKRRADERKTALFPVDGSLQEGDLDRFVDRICTDHIKKGICKDQRKEKEMKHRLITIVGWLFLVTSVGLLLYPEIISFIKQKQSDQIAQELEKNTGRRKNDDSLYQKALRYNEKIREDGQKDLKDVWSYQAPPIVLRKEQDTFGYIKIPKMKQKLPLYLGATMENMRKGATIMGQTSLPLGKRDSNCVIAAHRGYQGIPYFRDIEELKTGDLVIIRNPWERLRYKVTKIKVIGPYDTDKILIQKGKDMITLLTCHPYRGHGKYRYLVYCERDHGQKIKKQERTQQSDSSRKTIEEEKWIRYAGMFLLILTGGVWLRKREQGR